MRTTPCRRTTLHFTQIRLTDARTFIVCPLLLTGAAEATPYEPRAANATSCKPVYRTRDTRRLILPRP